MKYTRIILISFAAFMLFLWIRICILNQILSKNYAIAQGYIYRVSPGGWKASTPMFHYYYLVNDKRKYSKFTLNIHNQDTLVFLRKFFPVAYIPDNPNNFNAILVENRDFEDIGIPRPDSLKWVDEYIRK